MPSAPDCGGTGKCGPAAREAPRPTAGAAATSWHPPGTPRLADTARKGRADPMGREAAPSQSAACSLCRGGRCPKPSSRRTRLRDQGLTGALLTNTTSRTPTRTRAACCSTAVRQGKIWRAYDWVDDPDVVVIGGAEPEFGYEALNRVFGDLGHGARLVTMHGDLYRRTGEGLRLDTGPFSRGWRRRPGRRRSRPASPRRPSSSPLWRAAAERFRHIPGTIRPRTGPGL